MIVSMLMLVLGFTVLLLGADRLVKGAASLAKQLNVPQIVIGLTIVALGTSTPELIVNIVAALKGSPDLSYGNIIGSNTFNVFIILGISAMIYPLNIRKATFLKEIPFALLAAIVMLIMVNDHWFDAGAANLLSRGDGFILVGMFGLFLIYAHSLSKQGAEAQPHIKTYPLAACAGFILLGLGGLVLGGNWVVKYALVIAREMGISEKIIGLTIVAAGTSLPELATSAVAAYKKHSDIAIGNIVGSNIFNLLFVMGVTSIIEPPLYSLSFNTDQYAMILSMALLFIFILIPRRHRLERWQGGLLIAVYIAYAVFLLR
jgi:cation:H+ antiporter